MARGRTVGISGSAVFLATAGLYLAYVGVKDVPFFQGMREILQAQRPVGKTHNPFIPKTPTVPTTGTGVRANDVGVDRLVGNAAAAYPLLKNAFPSLQFLGYGLRPSGTSDHPRGLALDLMNPTHEEAARIIQLFKPLPGSEYWIWNRQIGNRNRENWSPRTYYGLSPHTDHVHLSFD